MSGWITSVSLVIVIVAMVISIVNLRRADRNVRSVLRILDEMQRRRNDDGH